MERFEGLRVLDPRLVGTVAGELADALDDAGLDYQIASATGGIHLHISGATDQRPIPGLLSQMRNLDPYMQVSGAWSTAAITLAEARSLAAGIRYRLRRPAT